MSLSGHRPSLWGSLGLSLWATLVVAPIAYLMAQHEAPLPLPATVPTAPSEAPASATKWRRLHLLDGECPCSAAIATGLAARGRLPDADDEIWLTGPQPEWAQALLDAGFPVRTRDRETVKRETGVEGAPWLVVVRADGSTAYSGGHTGVPSGRRGALRDVELCAAALAGQPVPALPAYGCALSEELRRARDPLQLKYRP